MNKHNNRPVPVPPEVASELRAVFSADTLVLARFLDEHGLAATARWVRRHPRQPARAFLRGFRVQKAKAQDSLPFTPPTESTLKELRRRFTKLATDA